MLAREREKRRREHGEDHLTSGVIAWRSQVGHMRIFFAQCPDKRVLMKFFWHTLILSIQRLSSNTMNSQSASFAFLMSEIRRILSLWHVASFIYILSEIDNEDSIQALSMPR